MEAEARKWAKIKTEGAEKSEAQIILEEAGFTQD